MALEHDEEEMESDQLSNETTTAESEQPSTPKDDEATGNQTKQNHKEETSEEHEKVKYTA